MLKSTFLWLILSLAAASEGLVVPDQGNALAASVDGRDQAQLLDADAGMQSDEGLHLGRVMLASKRRSPPPHKKKVVHKKKKGGKKVVFKPRKSPPRKKSPPKKKPGKKPPSKKKPVKKPVKKPPPKKSPPRKPHIKRRASPRPAPRPSPHASPKPVVRPHPDRLPSPRPSPVQRPHPSPVPSPQASPRVSSPQQRAPQASPVPSPRPSPVPSPRPSPTPSPRPSPVPSPRPSPLPSPRPSPVPSPRPSPVPSPRPSPVPSPQRSPQQQPQPGGSTTANVESQYPYGGCYNIDPAMMGSSWCSPPNMYAPMFSSGRVRKYGRGTQYGGEGGQGWCGVPLNSVPGIASVALSTKYVALNAVSPNSPTCGRCVCIRFNGGDRSRNGYPPNTSGVDGRTLKGIVHDRCAECDDDHVDICQGNAFGSVVDPGLSGTVGIWALEWQFADCNTDCSTFF